MRIGKQGPQVPHRLLKVKVHSQVVKRNLLFIHTVKKPSAPAVFIRPDLTKTQQELDKKLRDELRLKGKDFKIFRGKIVPRIILHNENSSPQTELRAALQPSTKVTVEPSKKTLTLPPVAKPSLSHSKSLVLTKPTTSAKSTSIISSANKFTVLQTITESSDNTEIPNTLSTKVDTGAALGQSSISQSPINDVSSLSPVDTILSDQMSQGSFAISSDLGQTSSVSASSDLEGASAALANQAFESDIAENWNTVPVKSQKSKSLSKAAGKTV